MYSSTNKIQINIKTANGSNRDYQCA